MKYCNVGASSRYNAAPPSLRASKTIDDCPRRINVYMDRVSPARSTLVRVCARLWAALALACVLSLAGTSVASAMDATAEFAARAPLAASASYDGDATTIDANQKDQKSAPAKGHCALCCAHACSSVAPTTPALPAAPTMAAARLPRLDTFLASGDLSTQDQPPRA
jgi:hypothetical protein